MDLSRKRQHSIVTNEPRLVTIRPKISQQDHVTYPNMVVAGGHVVYPNVVFSQGGVVAAHAHNQALQANPAVYPKHVLQHSEIVNRSLQANELVYPKHMIQQSEISDAQQKQILLNEQLLAAQEKQIQEQNKILQANELIYPKHLVSAGHANYVLQQNELVYPHQLVQQHNATLQANTLVYPHHLVAMPTTIPSALPTMSQLVSANTACVDHPHQHTSLPSLPCIPELDPVGNNPGIPPPDLTLSPQEGGVRTLSTGEGRGEADLLHRQFEGDLRREQLNNGTNNAGMH